jgi:hypothetical protein
MPPACPHCHVPIDPPPKRSRKCPHCRQPIVVRRGQLLTDEGVAEFEERLEERREAKRIKERDARLREFRRSTAEQLREAKRSGVVAGIEVLVSSDACQVCQDRRKAVYPIETCTVSMLPPYENCENEDGCDSAIVDVLAEEYGGPRRRKTGVARPRTVVSPKHQPSLIRTAVLIVIAAFIVKRLLGF